MLRPTDNEGLHRHGSETQRPLLYLQAERKSYGGPVGNNHAVETRPDLLR